MSVSAQFRGPSDERVNSYSLGSQKTSIYFLNFDVVLDLLMPICYSVQLDLSALHFSTLYS